MRLAKVRVVAPVRMNIRQTWDSISLKVCGIDEMTRRIGTGFSANRSSAVMTAWAMLAYESMDAVFTRRRECTTPIICEMAQMRRPSYEGRESKYHEKSPSCEGRGVTYVWTAEVSASGAPTASAARLADRVRKVPQV